MKFDFVEEHPISETVERKITLIDTTTRNSRSAKIQPYYSILGAGGSVSLSVSEASSLKPVDLR